MVRFRPGSRLDPSQVEDVRGSGSGFRLPGGGLAVGGGGLGVVGLLVYLAIVLLSGSSGLSGPLSTLDGSTVSQGSPAQVLGQECQTGADANTKEDCRIVGDINSVQAYWKSEFAAQGRSYVPATTVFFTGSTATGCGEASTAVGPFYCPVDKHVYIDLGFFDELRTQFGANGVRSRRPTYSRTSTGTTSRTCSGISASARVSRVQPADRCGRSSRRTATPASGLATQRRPAT